MGNNNPFLLIFSAITRSTKNGENLPGKGQINLKEIIKAFTINNAKSIKKEREIGSIKIGKNAVVGAGSALSKDVKDKSLSVTRANQVEIKNYKRK